MEIKPFVKWVGGKTQLLKNINNNLPEDLVNIDTYIEPFVGGGSVMFNVVPKLKNIKYVIINDLNSRLINVYNNIKYNHKELLQKLGELEIRYYHKTKNEQEHMYYEIRDEFNKYLNIPNNKNSIYYINNAAQFIFLNKTCFNGLYRENLTGKFNVSWNQSRKPLICDIENITNVHEFLNKYNVKCIVGDYQQVLDYVSENTFIYFDPPYRPLTETSAFTSYTKSKFNDDSQKELKQFCDKLNDMNCKFLLSNSDPKNSKKTDNFFDDLYNKYNIIRVHAKRNINSDGTKRYKINELLISNY